MCSYTPLELIYAAGFQPYRIEGHAREVNNSDSYTHANMCQVVRSTIDIAAEGGYDFLDGIIFVNSCDAMRRLHDVWKNFFPSKFIHLIDLPKGDIDPIRQAYLREEFQRLKKALEKQASKKIQYDDIKKAVDTYKESRKLFHQMNSLRLSAPPSISGCEIMQLISEFYSSDPILWNERVRTLIYEKNHVNSNEKINKNGKPRVLLSGSPLYNVDFVSLVENCGLSVVYEDICTGSKFFDLNVRTSEDILNSLSEAYLNKSPCARMMKIEERIANIYDAAKKYNVDGMIHHTLKFCDTYLLDIPRLKEIMGKNGLSVLFLETDGRLGSFDQMKTRLEAFNEMLENKKWSEL